MALECAALPKTHLIHFAQTRHHVLGDVHVRFVDTGALQQRRERLQHVGHPFAGVTVARQVRLVAYGWNAHQLNVGAQFGRLFAAHLSCHAGGSGRIVDRNDAAALPAVVLDDGNGFAAQLFGIEVFLDLAVETVHVDQNDETIAACRIGGCWRWWCWIVVGGHGGEWAQWNYVRDCRLW